MVMAAYANILESSTVTLASGTEDPSCPLSRLSDRNIGRAFMPTNAGLTEIVVDQGASPLQADRMLIPSGHGLDGVYLSLAWSDNGVLYTRITDPWTQSGTGLIDISWAACTHRWWKLTVNSALARPSLAELFITSTWLWERGPSRPAGPLDPVQNVERVETPSGKDMLIVRGAPRRRRRYKVERCPESQRAALMSLVDATAGGAVPFWLRDHEGQWIYGRLDGGTDVAEAAYGAYSYKFAFQEVLP